MIKRDQSSQQAFETYFTEVYAERWPHLLAALKTDIAKVVLKNPFGGALQNYSLDEASLLPAKHLCPEQGHKIADFCASPGGKSLATIFALQGNADWFCSDLSPARIARLKAVFHDCLPEMVLRRVRVQRGDASRWGMTLKSEFDRILVDAPCSGERHLLESPAELSRWSLKGSKRLLVRQHALLCSALDSLRPGGRLVYSTCSISPIENDGAIEKLRKSRSGLFRVIPVQDTLGEPTPLGWIVLPDKFKCGPIYFSILEKEI